MRVVAALGGNALLMRGEKMTAEHQRENVRRACAELAPIALDHELVISHGNGPQVGLLALQAAAYETESHLAAYPLDVLDAQTQGMIGYMIELELGNLLPFERPIATILTMIEVNADDPAFESPSKFIGPIYNVDDADHLHATRGWEFKRDGDNYRRVVPSPRPQRVFELRQIRGLLTHGCVVVCAGGGGIPTRYLPGRQLTGVEAVIDKDHASGLLARQLDADIFLMATDVDAAYVDWGAANQRAVRRANPAALREIQEQFPDGSMRPKTMAACEFAEATGARAVIGALTDITEMLSGRLGTTVTTQIEGIEYAGAPVGAVRR
jgi:carbamate kinase